MNRTSVWITACVMISSHGCAATTIDETPEVGFDQEALICGNKYRCSGDPIETAPFAQATCMGNAWPGGVIRYKFGTGGAAWDSNEQMAIQQVAADWGRITAGTLTLQYLPNGTSTAQQPIITLNRSGAGSSKDYTSCVGDPTGDGCTGWMDHTVAYHEFGHWIGLNMHHFQRYDRHHYWTEYLAAGDTACRQTRCGVKSAANLLDFGPFDFKSTMTYHVTHPDHARYSGDPIIAGVACNQIGFGPKPPQCGIGTGLFCSSCAACDADTNELNGVGQPNGFPTKGDVSAIAELYLHALDPHWGKFLRSVEEDTGAGAALPFDYTLAPGVTIPSTSTPTLETWENDSLSIYIKGSDNNIWKKFLDTSTNPYHWSTWASLGRPGGSGTLSDPSVVSWAAGRTDLVVTQGSSVYIMSTPTWGTWRSLGGPTPAPASAPAIASWGPSHLDVFVRATDDMFYHTWCLSNCDTLSNWSGWSALGSGTFIGKPAVSTSASNRLDLYGHGMDDRLWAAYFRSGAWGGWTQVPPVLKMVNPPGCADCGAPAAAARSATTGTVYVRDVNDMLWQLGWSEAADASRTWSMIRVGGVPTSSPATVTKYRTSSSIDLAVVMGEESTPGTMNYGVWRKTWH